MKSNHLLTIAAITSLCAPAFSANASKLSGELILLSGYSSTNSNLSTDTDATLRSLGGSAEREDDYLVAPLGHIAYSLGANNNQRIYLGTSRDDLAVGDLAFELGYQYDFANGTQIDVAFLPTVVSGEVWGNPYQTSSARVKEDIEGYAYRMKINNLMNSGFSLDMAFATSEVDNERIEYQSLHRDNDTYYVKGSYGFELGQRSGLVTSFAYTHLDAEGKAASFDQYKAEVTYFISNGIQSLALTSSYARREYDAIHPIFNKERADNRHKLFIAYEYANVMGWQNWNFVSLNGVNLNRSNIDFYENEDYLVSMGLSYKF
ncbi:DUF2860 family protein [Aliagarivorans marinus]|uniref:DUF2860 family protein n=1 Tax=Aliagarivorans marinus TaxID=561965 RepID=UPI000400E053|nr:DUF2860 family protein [Aliagarivorans marinus]